MPEKFQNKYRIASTRLQNWDYGWAGAYFITICTHHREHYFGEIENVKTGHGLSQNSMILSPLGAIADVFWHEIKNHAKNVVLGEFVVMPNHVHGILILTDENDNDNGNGNDNGIGIVETGHALSLQSPPSPPSPLPPSPLPPSQPPPKTIGQQRFQNIGKNSVSSVIGSYKSAVTKHAHRLGFEMEWQVGFYDHIIRDDGDYQRIAEYIIKNPMNWNDDKFNTK